MTRDGGHIEAVSWVGVKTDAPGEAVAFFRDVLELRIVVDQPSFAVFELPSGDKVEVFGPDGPDPAEQFAANRVVAGFRVDDIDAASARLRAAGVELLGELQVVEDGYAWQHFRGPDGLVYELTYEPARATPR